MASMYSSDELQLRSDILKTHIIFVEFLTADMIDHLVHLFNEKCCEHRNNHITISDIMKEERDRKGLVDDVIITSSAYNDPSNPGGSSIVLDIHKHGGSFVHFTAHLSIHELKPKHSGILHMYKDIYKSLQRGSNKTFYALINVEQPTPDSLHFSIGYGYDTPSAKNAIVYDKEVQQEMNMIIAVLNRLFNPLDTYYIGRDRTDPIEVSNTTNAILANMNSRTHIASRKNKGKMMWPSWNTSIHSSHPMLLGYINRKKTRRATNHAKITNKVARRTRHKKYNNVNNK